MDIHMGNTNATSDKKLVQVYRNSNIVLEDKLENEKENVRKVGRLLIDANSKLEKMKEERDYWKVKFNRKNSWFNWTYADDLVIPHDTLMPG